jgi:hypothetical protein
MLDTVLEVQVVMTKISWLEKQQMADEPGRQQPFSLLRNQVGPPGMYPVFLQI